MTSEAVWHLGAGHHLRLVEHVRGAGESVAAGVPASFEMAREAQPASASARSAAGTRLGIVSLISPSRSSSHLAFTIVMAMTAPVSS